MGSLCPGRVDGIWAENSPYASRILNWNSINTSYQLLPKNSYVFDQVYNVESRKIGFGHYGDVKKCIHKETGVVRAVKIFNKERVGSNSLNHSWFFKQIEVISQISHPSFIKCHEYFEERDHFFLVMDFHDGGDLLQKIRNSKRLREDQITIIKQVVIGVSYLHNLQIIHRDLKPENILINENQDEVLVKIIDFDTATKLSENGTASGVYGTSFYMAPELLSASYNEKCDIWSIGIIMYILLTNTLPYSGKSDHQILSSIQKIHIDFDNHHLLSVSENGKNLLKRLLSKDPNKRISATEALKHPWFTYEKSDIESIKAILENFGERKANSLIARDIFISNFAIPADHYKLDLSFLELDTNFDSIVSSDEIFDFYSKCCYDEEIAKEKSSCLLEKLRRIGEEQFTYAEFLSSGVNLKNILTGARIKNLLDWNANKSLTEGLAESLNSEDEINDWILQLKNKIEESKTENQPILCN